MDDSQYRQFFVEAQSNVYHRQYEALRAVFVEGRKQVEVADQFGYTYNSFRQLVHEFRESFQEGDGRTFFRVPHFGRPPCATENRQKRQKPVAR